MSFPVSSNAVNTSTKRLQ